MERILIFANPIAGRGRGQAIARRLEKSLSKQGYSVRVLLKRPDALGPDDLPPDAKAAIVIGGDGTLRSVADRLCHHQSAQFDQPAEPLVNSGDGAEPAPALAPLAGPPLLVVPLGTANLMGRHLGIQWEDHTLETEVARAIVGGKIMALDAGRANGRIFLLMVGVGFDAAVVHHLARIRKGPIRMLTYVLPAALALRDYEYPSLRVEIDGKSVFGPVPAVAFVGNVREYGTGFPLLPRARPDDGLLDVCVMPCRSPVDLARYLVLSTTGDHLFQDGVIYRRGRHVTIDAAEPIPAQVDGDAFGHTPITADLLPLRLPFIVP